jgi:hypothetical protein
MVTVTTVRFDEPQGEPAWERQSTAEGEFATAVLQALTERLERWALHQVLGKVLARRPDDGEPIEYEGLWGDLRTLLILVLPVIDGQVLDCEDWPVVEIPGLHLPELDAPVLADVA